MTSILVYADDNDTYVLQFDMKVLSYGGDFGIGIAICNTNNNVSIGRFVAANADRAAWAFCSKEDNSTNWSKNPGNYKASGIDPNQNVVTVKFVFNKDMTVQQLCLNDYVADSILTNAGTISDSFDIGLYFLKIGTVEIDNLLVYSYNSAAN